MKVYIVRHGEVPQNILRKYSVIDEDLTDLGIEQAKELREKIRDIKFDIVISSPFIRAKHTAAIVNVHNIETVFDDRLKERNCGDLSGKSFAVTDREVYWSYDAAIQYGTSEDIKSFFRRVWGFLDELKGKAYENVLIVAHSGVSKAFSAYFEGIKDGKFLNRGLQNCEVKVYEL